jgi:DNA processing protein
MHHVLLHLNLIEGVGPATVSRLIKTFETLSDLYQVTQPELVHQFGLSPVMAEKIVVGLSDAHALHRELVLLEKYQIKTTSVMDDDYPSLLREIYAPPMVLYYQGELPWHTQNMLAFVGSRKANDYARQAVAELVPPLVALGWVTVSGGALGADSMVHQETLNAGGKTIAVLGSGLLCSYPSANRSLFKSIAERGGAVVSSFPVAAPPQAGNFPARNRIISGLSRGCVVVQAAAKSGALITAKHALEQGRDVFAIPGKIDDSLSEGCHQLIQQGAKLVGGAGDIISEYQ